MGTKENPGDFDCYGAAAPDEPIFILRSTDRLAPIMVENWAFHYRFAREQNGSEMTREQSKKYEEALNTAQKMREFRRRLDR